MAGGRACGRGIGLVAGLVLATLCGAGGAARAARAADPTFSDLQQAPTPEAAYAANAYAIVHVGKTDRVNEPGSTWRPVRGLVYRISLDPDVFLESVGRTDLATRERSHHNSARTLSVAGYLFGCAGVVVAVAGFGYGHNVIGVVGLGSLVGGAIAHEVGEARLDPVLPEDRALQLAADYNRDLRVRLGLPAEVAPPRRDPWTRGPAPGFAAAPLLFARGGGLGLGFRF